MSDIAIRLHDSAALATQIRPMDPFRRLYHGPHLGSYDPAFD